MNEFISANNKPVIYGAVIVITLIILRIITHYLHKWLTKKAAEKFPGQRPRTLNFLKRILNALYIVLAIIALSFIFIPEKMYAAATKDFKVVLYLGVVAVITIVAATTVNLWFKHSIQKKIQLGQDSTSSKFLKYVAVFAVYIVGLLFASLAFPSLKTVAQTALGGAGVLAVIAGIASQEALSNVVSGLFIVSFKPFRIGDTIEISGSVVGKVIDITLRHTLIQNYENKMMVVPNSIMNKEKLLNYDLRGSKCCEHVEIGISYDSDIDLAKKILQEECEKHPKLIDNRNHYEKKDGKPKVKVALTKLNDSSITIRAWAWSSTYGDSFTLQCDVLESTKKRFDKEGIEIPFPYTTVVIKQTKKEEELDS